MDKFVKILPKKRPEKSVKRTINTVSAETPGSVGFLTGTDITKGNTPESAENVVEDISEAEIQCLEFSSPLLSDDFHLMEITTMLADQIMSGEQFVIRGDPEDSPVLCTRDKSFEMKEVVTSNAMLLLPEFHFSDTATTNRNTKSVRKVNGMKLSFMELREITHVSTARLKELLHDGELEWNEQNNVNKKLYTVADLLDVIQMSEVELCKALEHLPVINLNGYVCLLSAEYRDRLVSELIDCLDDAEETDITLESVSFDCLTKALKKRLPDNNIPLEAVQWLHKNHCDIVGENDSRTFVVNEKAICRARISQLLRAAVRFEYSTFEKTLRQVLPVGVEFKEEYLEGLAFVDDSLATGKTVCYLNVEDLPEEPYKRLQLLFSLRQPWKVSEIRQYLKDLCPTMRLLNEMFLNYCWQSTVNGEKVLTGLKETVP